MQTNEPLGVAGLFNINQLEYVALNVVENFCVFRGMAITVPR